MMYVDRYQLTVIMLWSVEIQSLIVDLVVLSLFLVNADFSGLSEMFSRISLKFHTILCPPADATKYQSSPGRRRCSI